MEVARSFEDAERLRPAWDRVAWEREEAELDYLLARVQARAEAIAPFAVFVLRGDEPVAALAARAETRRLAAAIGYRTRLRARGRLLQVVDGGIVALRPRRSRRCSSPRVRAELARGAADAVALPPLAARLAARDGVRGARRAAPAAALHRAVDAPDGSCCRPRSRSSSPRAARTRAGGSAATRSGSPRSSATACRVRIVRDPSELDLLVRDADRVARRRTSAPSAPASPTRPSSARSRASGSSASWLRGYLLYVDDEPVAYWLCALHGDTMLIKTAGFDTAYERLRIGIYLLMRAIEDACADPEIRVLDFGPGDAAYKQQFSQRRAWQERNAVVLRADLPRPARQRRPDGDPRLCAARAARRSTRRSSPTASSPGGAHRAPHRIGAMNLRRTIRRAADDRPQRRSRPALRRLPRRHDQDEAGAPRRPRRRQRRVRRARRACSRASRSRPTT